jgi:hypothetical protein
MRSAMNAVSPAIEALARRLLAFESSRGSPSDAQSDRAAQVCERLRGPISKFAGLASYRSILSRALALAKAEVPALGVLRVAGDGSMEGLDELTVQPAANPAKQGGAVLVAQLLGLLVTFIGEPLALALVRDAWPEAAREGIDLGTNAKP